VMSKADNRLPRFSRKPPDNGLYDANAMAAHRRRRRRRN
jgi:hypothetical protein